MGHEGSHLKGGSRERKSSEGSVSALCVCGKPQHAISACSERLCSAGVARGCVVARLPYRGVELVDGVLELMNRLVLLLMHRCRDACKERECTRKMRDDARGVHQNQGRRHAAGSVAVAAEARQWKGRQQHGNKREMRGGW